MSTILGLDLGTNSIGWAIRNTSEKDDQIIDYGVLTFEKGVATAKGNEFPKVQKRTESRGKRRNYQAEKYRKYKLLEFLIHKDMCPLTIDELDRWRKYSKLNKREYPQSEPFLQWLRFDFNGDGKPDFHLLNKGKDESYYAFRAFAVNEDLKPIYKNNPHILGRVFYQLVQRRGFRGRDEEEAKTMLEGSDKNGTAGRNEISEYIQKQKTLGAALYYYQKENGGRIRQRYNLRKDYEEELKQICKVHSIADEDYQKLWRAIIWQRPLRTQKGTVGMCIYEKNKRRAPVSHPLYEEYRTWTFINNLNIQPPQGKDKATYLKEKIYPLFYKSSNDFELKSVLTQLKDDGAITFAKFKENTKVISARLLNSFRDILGEDWKEKYGWEDIHNREPNPKKKTGKSYNFEDIWHVLNTFDGQENLKKFALEKLELEQDKAEKFSKIKLNQGYATLSLSAIKKILPFLQKGFIYSQAVYMANLYRVLGTDVITPGFIEQFAEEVEKILKDNNREKTINNIVNALIADEISEGRYAIENDRDLDDSEKKRISKKIADTFTTKDWDRLDETGQQQIVSEVSFKFKEFLATPLTSKNNAFIRQPRLHDEIFNFLRKTHGVAESAKKHLWHPSEQENYSAALEYEHFVLDHKNIYVAKNKAESFAAKYPEAEFQGRSLRLLGSPEPVSKGFKNPMALKTMHKLKQLVNYLLKTGKIYEDTRIVIEIARELNDANKRKAIERWNTEREKENESFKKIIREINKEGKTNFDENDKTLIRKIRLWTEQGKMCLYTGKNIKGSDVFNGVLYDIEHTIPASVSFDNELKNLTLSDTNYNRNIKRKLFPTQLPNYDESAVVGGQPYPAIIGTMERIFGKRSLSVVTDKKGREAIKVSWRKIEDLETLYDQWKTKAKFASTKDVKDACIQRKHMIKMDLDYWKGKLRTFILEEYNPSWKNSQLRDTQIVTKYTLPYLKTVFSKVAVEKAEVVTIFKEVYNIKLPFDKKDRKVHSHHAMDAAVLTLIPPFYERDKIVQKYNDEKDKKTGDIYHEQPKDWKGFSASKVLFIENKIFINNLPENKTTVQTYKKIRKRGKIDTITYKDANGAVHNKLDENGNVMPKIARGDTIRGQLHGETLYGAIKQPLRNENNKILFNNDGMMKLGDKIYVVVRKPLIYKKDANSPGFKNLEEVEKVIVDRGLFEMIKKQVEDSDFKTAIAEGVYMLGKNGERINKIRRIRCIEGLTYDAAVKVHTHRFGSDKEYKQTTLAINGENTLCLFYKSKDGSKKVMDIQSIGQVSASKITNDIQYFDEPYYNLCETGKGKKKDILPLYAVLRAGQKALFYTNTMEELAELLPEELSRRLYKIYQFEGDGRIKFRHHLAAGMDTELKKEHKEASSFDENEKQVFLRLTQKQWNFAIEGRDFEMNLDGTIVFKF